MVYIELLLVKKHLAHKQINHFIGTLNLYCEIWVIKKKEYGHTRDMVRKMKRDMVTIKTANGKEYCG